MSRILVCGGRDYDDYHRMAEVFVDHVYPGDVIIHGDARGADRLSERVAQPDWVTFERYPADWEKYGKAAGPIRNQQMLDEGRPDYVLAFPGGKGTRDMVERAKKAGIKVVEVE